MFCEVIALLAPIPFHEDLLVSPFLFLEQTRGHRLFCNSSGLALLRLFESVLVCLQIFVGSWVSQQNRSKQKRSSFLILFCFLLGYRSYAVNEICNETASLDVPSCGDCGPHWGDLDMCIELCGTVDVAPLQNKNKFSVTFCVFLVSFCRRIQMRTTYILWRRPMSPLLQLRFDGRPTARSCTFAGFTWAGRYQFSSSFDCV